MANNKKALNQFITKTENIQAMLKRIQKEVDNHLGYEPEDINFEHVGLLSYYEIPLKQISDSMFKEGEYEN